MARGKWVNRQPDNIRRHIDYLFFGLKADREAAGLSMAEAQQRRVAFVIGHNMEAADPQAAAITLDQTGQHPQRNRRLERAQAHFIVSFDKHDGRAGLLSEDKQRDFAAAVIERMGLGEYRGLVVSHKDTENPHLHFSFSRVHPDTGQTWSDKQAGKRLQGHVREIAREYGLNVSKAYEQGAERTTEAEYHNARREGRPPRQEFLAADRAAIRDATLASFREAKDWGDLAGRLEAQGYRLAVYGRGAKRGLYLETDTHRAKVSEIFGKEKDVRLSAMQVRFGQDFPDTGREHINVTDLKQPDALDAEAMARIDALREAIAERAAWKEQVSAYHRAEFERQTFTNQIKTLQDQMAVAQQRQDAARADIQAAILDAFTNPEHAQKAWEAFEREARTAKQAARIAFEPDSLGTLKGTLRAGFKNRARKRAELALERMKKARGRYVEEQERLQDAQASANAVRALERDAADKAARLKLPLGTPEHRRETNQEFDRRVDEAAERVTPKEIRAADLPAKERRAMLAAVAQVRERDQGGWGLDYEND